MVTGKKRRGGEGQRKCEETRRRLTLPGGHPPSTIGADGLNCRVRDETGCFPVASDTTYRHTCTGPQLPKGGEAHETEDEAGEAR